MFGWIRNLFTAKNQTEERTNSDLSIDELRARIDRLSKEAGLSGIDEARRSLEAGDLEDTPLEVELKMLRFLEDRTGSHKERERELIP